MEMTAQQKYSTLLEELGALLQDKNTTISCQKWQIDELTEKLAAAEEERDFAKEKLADASFAIDLLQADVAELEEKLSAVEHERDEAIAELNALHKGGAE